MAIALLLIASSIGYRAADTVPGREYYNLKAEFTAADNLSNHYEVRIGGLRAGQILKPRVENGKAVVDLRLDKKFAPLRSDTKTQVRLRSAVGVRYLELIPGKRGRVLREGDTLKAGNQVANTSLPDALGTLDPKTRQKAATLLNVLGQGATDNGDDINLALKKLTPFLKDVQTLAEPIVAQAGITGRLIRNTDAAVGSFDAIRDTFANTFSPARAALRPFADDADAIGTTLDEATPTLDQLETQLPQINRLIAAVNGLATDGRPALQAAPPALRQTTALMRGARPALRQAKGTLDRATSAVDPTLNLLKTLQPQLPRLDETMTSILPTLRTVGPRACEIGNAFGTWAGYQNHGIGERGHFIHFLVSVHPADFLGGQTSERLPGPDGKPLLDAFVHQAPYPEPCRNGEGEAGKIYPTAREQAQDLDYSQAFPVVR